MCLLRTLFLIVCVAISANASAMDKIETNLISHVKHLSEDIGSRSYLEIEKLNKTADYIEATFRSYKCNVKRQSFIYENNTYYNIEAEVRGASDKDKIIVIGAHYDTVIGTPGADDNASGVAGLLELARLTAEKPLPLTVRFVAFALEEPPFFRTRNMGSYVYAESLKNEAADVKGMKIRVQQSDLWVSLISAMGANATPMPYGEVYTALKTGIIDAAENNIPSFDTAKHAEAVKFYSRTEHSMAPEILVMSKISYDKLPKAEQDMVRKAAKDSVIFMRQKWDEQEAKSLAKVKAEGAQFVDVDKASFQAVMGPVYDKFMTTPDLKRLVKTVQDTK